MSSGLEGGLDASIAALPVAEARATRVRYRVLALVFLISLITFVDRVNLSVAARAIMPEYGLTEVQMGTIFSAFILGYMLGFVPGGRLADRFGPRRVLASAMVVWSLFTVATAWAGDLVAVVSAFGVMGSFWVVRLLFGLTEGPALPTANRLIASWFPSTEKALATSSTTTGASFGAILGPPAIAWIMVTWGWRAVFWVTGGLGIMVAAVWLAYCRDRPEDHPGVNEGELRTIRAGTISGHVPSGPVGPLPWRALLTERSFWLLAASYALGAYIAYVYASWFYLYLVNHLGFELQTAGWLAALPYVAAVVIAPSGGRVSDLLVARYGRRVGRVGCVCAALALASVCLFVGASTSSAVLAVAALSMAKGFLFMTTPVKWTIVAEMAGPHAGAATGALLTCGHVGAVLGPTLAPWMAQQMGWAAAFRSMAVLALAGAVLTAFVNPDRSLLARRAD